MRAEIGGIYLMIRVRPTLTRLREREDSVLCGGAYVKPTYWPRVILEGGDNVNFCELYGNLGRY